MPPTNDKHHGHGQTNIAAFFGKKKKSTEGELTENSTETSENINNNIAMGLDSNLRKSAIQKAKEFGTTPKKITQRKIGGGAAEGRCDEGTSQHGRMNATSRVSFSLQRIPPRQFSNR